MDWTIILQQLGELGVLGIFIAVVAWFGYRELEKRDAKSTQQYEDLQKLNDKRIDDLKEDIRIIREESKEEKVLFRESIHNFSRAIDEFSGINNKIDNLEVDVAYIKKNINK